MDVALYHDLPPAGGAIRVLAEYVRHSPQHEFTLYTHQLPGDGLVRLDDRVEVRRFARAQPGSAVGRLRQLRDLARDGKRLAEQIDAAGHDACFCHSSVLTQAPEVLPWLRTPTLYYAPEPLRSWYETLPAFGRRRSVKATLVRWRIDPYERLRARLDRRHIRGAQRVVTHSHFTAEALRRAYGVDADVVHLGVDAADYPFSPGEREAFVLSVGALHPLKGHQFVIAALATLPVPRPRLVVVGDRGELEPDLRALAQSHDVALDVRRGLPQPELVELYRHAGAVACGQIREPFGLITLEAMAAGAPVVAVREGGFVETVQDGVTGLLVDRDPRGFGAAIARVLDDHGLAERLRTDGRQAAETDWTWERTARGHDALLAELTSSLA